MPQPSLCESTLKSYITEDYGVQTEKDSEKSYKVLQIIGICPSYP